MAKGLTVQDYCGQKESETLKKTATLLQSLFMYGAPDRIRTYGLLIRSPILRFPLTSVSVRIWLFSRDYMRSLFHG